MLKSRDQLYAREFYNLPENIAIDLLMNGFAVKPDEPGPSEIKPVAPTEFKAKKKQRRARTENES